MSTSNYVNKAVNGVVGGVTGAAGSLLNGAASAVGNVFDGVTGAFGDLLGIFTSQTSEKHFTLSYEVSGAGAGVKPDTVGDRSGISRINSARPPAKNINDEIKKNKDDKEIKFETYPPDLSYSKYFFEIQFGEYVRPFYGEKSDSTRFTPSFIARLPLPPQLSDAQTLGWTNANLGPTGLAMTAAQQAGQFVNNEFGGGNNPANWQRIGEGLTKAGLAVGEAGLYGVGAAMQNRSVLGVDVAAAVGNLLGYSMNPFPGAFYVGPELRQFQFSWNFVPESDTEMNTIKSILNQIRKRTLSQPTGQLGAFLKYPEICKIILHPDKLKTMHPFKECVLTGINIDYAPYGLSFHTDQNPTAIAVGMIFAEIRPLFRADVDQDEEKYNIAGQADTPLYDYTQANNLDELLNNAP